MCESENMKRAGRRRIGGDRLESRISIPATVRRDAESDISKRVALHRSQLAERSVRSIIIVGTSRAFKVTPSRLSGLNLLETRKVLVGA